MINAKGSRFDKTSFGTPLVVIVAAWDVKLLFSWLYVIPKSILKSIRRKHNNILTVEREPEKHGARFEPTMHLIHPLIVECHPDRLLYLFAWFSIVPEPRGREVIVQRERVEAPFTAGSVKE